MRICVFNANNSYCGVPLDTLQWSRRRRVPHRGQETSDIQERVALNWTEMAYKEGWEEDEEESNRAAKWIWQKLMGDSAPEMTTL